MRNFLTVIACMLLVSVQAQKMELEKDQTTTCGNRVWEN